MADYSPIGWALQPLKKYASFSGRAPRSEFWWFFLFVIILYALFSVVMVGAIGGMAESAAEPQSGMVGAMGGSVILMMLFWLALLIPTIAVQVRRLHDINRSGWWVGGFYLLYLLYFVLIIGAFGSAMEAGVDGSDPAVGGLAAGTMVVALVMLIYGITLLVFYCLPGTRGFNRYGPDPYGQDVEQVFA